MHHVIPGFFEPDYFTKRRPTLTASKFIRPMHPKTEIRADEASVQKVMNWGWIGQVKIHGHRAQIHVPAEAEKSILVYNRQGALHKKVLPEKMDMEIRRLFTPKKGWNIIDTEWLKAEDQLYVFDFVKKDGILLRNLNYLERYELLPRAFISPHIQILSILKTPDQCMNILKSTETHIEGLVFKSTSTKGFEDTSIIRCRKKVLH